MFLEAPLLCHDIMMAYLLTAFPLFRESNWEITSLCTSISISSNEAGTIEHRESLPVITGVEVHLCFTFRLDLAGPLSET